MGLLVISSHVWDSCATINRPGPGLWEAGQDVATPLQGLLLEGFTFATELVNRYENLTPQRLRENQLGRRRASRKLWEEEGPGIRIHSTWGFPPPISSPVSPAQGGGPPLLCTSPHFRGRTSGPGPGSVPPSSLPIVAPWRHLHSMCEAPRSLGSEAKGVQRLASVVFRIHYSLPIFHVSGHT